MSQLHVGETTVLYHRQRSPEILLTKHPVTLPSGHSFEAHTLQTGGATRSVVVVAVRGDEFLMVESYRPSLGRMIWELPRGFGEGDPASDEQAVKDGERELLEESGYRASHSVLIGEFTLDTTFYPSTMAVIRCDVEDAVPTGEPDGEVERSAWFPLLDIPNLKRNGTIRDGASLAALSLANM